MAKSKRRLKLGERQASKERKRKFMVVFIGGKQKRVPRQPLIDGLSAAEFLVRNADPIWLHENAFWEDIDAGRFD